MKIDVISLFPEMIVSACQHGVLGQALKKQALELHVLNPRTFTDDVHKTVDDRPFGGGDGMMMMAEPLIKSFASLMENLKEKPHVIYLSPQGQPLNDSKVRALAQKKHLILLCGRYGGVDQRLLNSFVDEEISLGDYVLSGGELAACTLIDAVSRMIPGVLGHAESSEHDSFSQGLLEEPQYTRPREILEQSVPEILLSGNHAKIQSWKWNVSLLMTLQKRPDLILQQDLNKKEIQELKKFWQGLSEEDKKSLGLKLVEDDFYLFEGIP